MSFRGIDGAIDRKISFIEKKNSVESDLYACVSSFVGEHYGATTSKSLNFSLEYTPTNKRLSIKTNSKAFANDLLLKIGLLTKYLIGRGAKINEIVIK